MPRKPPRVPSADDTFLERICVALGETPRQLARSIDVHYERDMRPLLKGERAKLAEIDVDEVWWLILEYTTKRIGLIMAVRDDMNKALQRDRAKRVLRQERFKDYHETK